MRKAKSLKILFFLGLACLSVYSYFYYEKQLTDQFIQEGKLKLILMKSADHVWSLWRKGKDSPFALESCVKKAEDDGRCDSDFIRCQFQSGGFEFFGSKILTSKIEEFNKLNFGRLAPREGVRLRLSLESSHLTVVLEKKCNKLFLPQRIYGFGPDKNPEIDHRFDNFERLIFIDKETTPAKGMTFKEMKKQCSLRGMQLLESHILDAASFHPVDLRNNRPQELLRPPYPWGRAEKTEFLYKASQNPEFPFEKRFCDYIYTSECEKDVSLPSWMGMKNPLGGLMEVVRNITFEQSILVPSSRYFSIHSKWHRLGLRANWNGEEFDKRDFDFNDDPPKIEDFSSLEMGFRCMQEVWQ